MDCRLHEVSRRYPHELSGGQIQRVSVARALIPKPRLILADEPVSMVDASLRMSIVNLFRKLRDEQQVSVVYITHDLATAYYISDRISIMLRGYVVESGPVEAVLDRPSPPLHPALAGIGAQTGCGSPGAVGPGNRTRGYGGHRV